MGANQECFQCHFSCLSCSSPEEDKCLECDEQGNREKINDKCVCKEGYFESGFGLKSCFKIQQQFLIPDQKSCVG